MKIPQGSIIIQQGLYLYEYTKTINRKIYKMRDLYASDGYCFWQVSNEQNYNYDEKTGEIIGLKPLSDRLFMNYCKLASSMASWSISQVNEEFKSVLEKEIENVD